jgi:hypothetical protein
MAGPEDYVQDTLDVGREEAEQAARAVETEPRSGYFDGHDRDGLPAHELDPYGIGDGAALFRHSYLYAVEFPTSAGGRDESENGLIELRSKVYTRNRTLPQGLKATVKSVAHKAGTLFNSNPPAYSGYLDGFLAGIDVPGGSGHWEDTQQVTPDTEDRHEPAIGKVAWNVEIYDGDQRLSGLGLGIAYPWTVSTRHEPGESPQHVAPHKWGISWNRSLEKYDVHPPGRTEARQRYQPGGAAHNKTVVINGLPVGNLDSEGRTWLFPDYTNGDTFTDRNGLEQYDREALVDRTGATYQALRDGGTLYLTGETETRINLVTAAEKPPGYQPSDPDNVSVSMGVQPGREGRTERRLDHLDPDDGIPLLCTADERIIRHLGLSSPEYREVVVRRWEA